ncbi:uncharacterized protein LOC111630661 [Centruroides sculpturatus]|uniref:uncharacterized protein LOC111630661 n=1 Tax=Centruroides sculpturatus TaxID=218467 RepID=UPI000C6DE704|nr:uncharacterized protein LOC111630661 [Centruroides sculpturatus]
MAEPTDSSLVFFTKATPEQWNYVLSLYKDVLKAKASTRTKKGGPEELVRLDTWYQEQLPKIIHSRKEPHITHEELIQIIKWKLIRGKFRPRLIDLVRINTESSVFQISKKAFRRIPKISSAINALTSLKGIGPASASAILAAAYPEHVPYMADESMLSTPGVEGTDYTLSEYLNYYEKIKVCTNRLNSLDSERRWNPHKVELALWTHYLARELKASLLDNMPKSKVEKEPELPNGNEDGHASEKKDDASNEEEKSADELVDNTKTSHSDKEENQDNTDRSSITPKSTANDTDQENEEPESKRARIEDLAQ